MFLGGKLDIESSVHDGQITATSAERRLRAEEQLQSQAAVTALLQPSSPFKEDF